MNTVAMERTEVMVRGQRMAIHPGSVDVVISRELADRGVFEPFETELVLKNIRRGDWVIDIGANIGYYTLLFSRKVGRRGRVVAFEPDPNNFDILEHNVRRNRLTNVTLVNKAVADIEGSDHLYLCDTNQGDHRLYDSLDGRSALSVPTVDLDSFFAGEKRAFDLVKFDIQGCEWRAFQGMQQFLKRHERLKMVVEFWPYGMSRAGADPRKLLEFLEVQGFQYSEIDETTNQLIQITREQLLNKYPSDSIYHTNLWCVKGQRQRNWLRSCFHV